MYNILLLLVSYIETDVFSLEVETENQEMFDDLNIMIKHG